MLLLSKHSIRSEKVIDKAEQNLPKFHNFDIAAVEKIVLLI